MLSMKIFVKLSYIWFHENKSWNWVTFATYFLQIVFHGNKIVNLLDSWFHKKIVKLSYAIRFLTWIHEKTCELLHATNIKVDFTKKFTQIQKSKYVCRCLIEIQESRRQE